MLGPYLRMFSQDLSTEFTVIPIVFQQYSFAYEGPVLPNTKL